MALAIEDLAAPLRAQGTVVDIAVDLRSHVAPDVAATLYRCAREGLANVRKHAHATHVDLVLTSDEKTALLRLHDDGSGLPASELDGRVNGHLGLQLLRDAAKDLGGEMVAASGEGDTTLTMRLPIAGIPAR